MAFTDTNIPLIHKKVWQPMTPAPVISGNGVCVTTDVYENDNLALLLTNATLHYLYHHDEDAFVQIPSGNFLGTFGLGTSACRIRWSNTITANGGSTTTATTATQVNGIAKGKTIRFLTGANAGRESIVTSVYGNPGGTSTITFNVLPSAVVNTDTFIVSSGRFLVLNGGTQSAGSFKSYDPLTSTWTTLSQTGIPASLTADTKLVATPSDTPLASGTATSATSTTLTVTGKTWDVNKWTNSQIRITGGTGIGQVRTISSNTNTVLTVPTWTVTPDATSTYEIAGNDDFVYLFGNAAVTAYRYSVSGNTWSTLAPTVARASFPSTGMSANWATITGDAAYDNENTGFAGRFIYSFRGGTGGALDRLDISGGTAGATAWANIPYNGLAETFTTGSSFGIGGKYIYCKQNATNRFFKYSLTGNYLEPLSTLLYPDGGAVYGDKTWIKNYSEGGVIKRSWLYNLGNSTNIVHRIQLF